MIVSLVSARDQPQLVELIVDRLTGEEDPRASLSPRERDAQQLVQKIIALTGSGPSFQYRDIALLFRAMTDVPIYEAEFRRAGIPFQTVLGKGFYEREEITDLIQLCRFLDNRTDEFFTVILTIQGLHLQAHESKAHLLYN